MTEAEAKRTLALPFFNNLQVEAIDEVCNTLDQLLKKQQNQKRYPGVSSQR